MKQFTMNDIEKIRGFKGITQGEVRIEQMLLNNINELNGQALGIHATRDYLLKNEFDRKSLDQVTEMFVEANRKGVDVEENNMMKEIAVQLFSKVVRHDVTYEYAMTFGQAILNRVRLIGNKQSACDRLEFYFVEGETVSVHQTYWEAEKELEEGAIIYDVPESTVS